MNCNHEIILDRMCQNCGLIVEDLAMSDGWWNIQKNKIKTSPSNIHKFLLKGKLDITPYLNDIINCKKKQKRINFFPILLQKYNYSPFELMKILKLEEKDCIKICYGKDLNFNWTNLLKFELKKKQKMEKFDYFLNLLKNSKDKEKIIVQIKKLI